MEKSARIWLRARAASAICAVLLVTCACTRRAEPAPTGPQQAPPAIERPNVVILLADDLGYGDLSAYGATDLITSNLDRLAADGVRLTARCPPVASCPR